MGARPALCVATSDLLGVHWFERCMIPEFLMGFHDLQRQGGWVPPILTYIRIQGEISFALSKKANDALFTELLIGLHDLHGVQSQGGRVPPILTYVRVQGEISFALSKKVTNA